MPAKKDVPSSPPTVMTSYMLPDHANRRGKVFGGHLLSLIDISAAVCAMRFCGTFVVTGHIETSFLKPVDVGDLVTFTATIASVGTSSMVVALEASAEALPKQDQRLVAKAKVTMIAVDEKGKSCAIQRKN